MTKLILSSIQVEDLAKELSPILKVHIKDILTELESERIETSNKKYLTRKEVAERLHISLPTLNNLTKKGILTIIRLEGRVLYDWNEVENKLQEITSTKYKMKL